MYINPISLLRWTPEQAANFDLAEFRRALKVLLAECDLNHEGGIRHERQLLGKTEVRRILEDLEEPAKREAHLWLLGQADLTAYLSRGVKQYFKGITISPAPAWPIGLRSVVAPELAQRYGSDVCAAYDGRAPLILRRLLAGEQFLPLDDADREHVASLLRQCIDDRVLNPVRVLNATATAAANAVAADKAMEKLAQLLGAHVHILNALPDAFQDVRNLLAELATNRVCELCTRISHRGKRNRAEAIRLIAKLRLTGEEAIMAERNREIIDGPRPSPPAQQPPDELISGPLIFSVVMALLMLFLTFKACPDVFATHSPNNQFHIAPNPKHSVVVRVRPGGMRPGAHDPGVQLVRENAARRLGVGISQIGIKYVEEPATNPAAPQEPTAP